MSLPDRNIAWPPAPHDRVQDQCTIAQAWWEGDPHLLADAAHAVNNRPSQYRGGIVGAAARTLWGKPHVNGENARKTHIPIAADIAQMSANLLFADPPAFLIAMNDGEDDAQSEDAQDRLDRIMNTVQHHASLVVAAETCAALGGVYARVVWDEDIVDNCWLDYVDADMAVPEFKWGRLTAVTFWLQLATSDDRVWRHLQRYEAGRIVHGLYMGDAGELGRPMPLDHHVQTAGLVSQIDAESAVYTGTDRIAAAYVPNARPNPAWRQDSQLKHLGRADISPDVIPLMDALDEAWTSLMRDMRLGRARIVVSEDLTRNLGPGKGSAFDADQEIFTTVGVPFGSDGSATSLIQSEQFAIRVEEHLRTATALVLEILRRTGYSPITFGMDEGGTASTATEIEARKHASNTTRTGKGRLWSSALASLGRTLLEVDNFIFGTGIVVTEDLEVQWPPSTRETMLQTSRTLQALTAAQAASTHTKVAMLHTDWDEARVAAEVAEIMAETGLMLPDFGPVSEADYAPPAQGGQKVGAKLDDPDTVADGTKEPDDQ